MKGVILSGGKGSRLAPITDDYPKQLIPVLGKPILLHCIDYLRSANIKDICIILSPATGQTIIKELSEFNLDVNLTYVFQDQPLGLAHAVNCAKDFTQGDDFVVLLGDNLFDKEIKDLVDEYYNSKADSLIMLKEVDRPYEFGVAKFDASGRVETLVEKPKTHVSNYAIVGVYIFNQSIFSSIAQISPSGRGELEITDAIAHQVAKGLNVHTDILNSFWFDSGTRAGLLDANKTLLLTQKNFDNVKAKVIDSFVLGNVALGAGSRIENSTLLGPIFIGKNVTIKNSTIGPFSSISDNCVIENSELLEVIAMPSILVKSSRIVSSLVFKQSVIKNEAMVINCLSK